MLNSILPINTTYLNYYSLYYIFSYHIIKFYSNSPKRENKMRRETLVAVALIAALFVVEIRPHDACRVIGGDFDGTLLQALQKGTSPPSGDGCTYTPGQGGAPCLNSRKFFGRRFANKDRDHTAATVAMSPPAPRGADQILTKLPEDDAVVVNEK